MKILHITNWYFSKSHPYKAPFIKEHYNAINQYTDGKLVHVEVLDSRDKLISFKYDKLSDREESFIVTSRIKKWFVKELLSTLLLVYVLYKKRKFKYEQVIVHEAYPLLTYYHLWKLFIQKPIAIIEHWTAFHYNFNLPKETKKLNRIKRIFQRKIPLITVSNRLRKDIEEFCKSPINAKVIPNVVNSDTFFFDSENDLGEKTFFMVNYWRHIKNPSPILNAFKIYVKEFPSAKLRIGGYGPLWPTIEGFVSENHLENVIKLLGPLNKKAIANELKKASALLHTAEYETFSVVCAEAISCGCPVIVKNLEAVSEFINEENGVFVNSDDEWLDTLRRFESKKYNRKLIAKSANSKFDSKVVGREIYTFLKNSQ